ncbi:uncharacterized protein BYT42DRAFT_556455 [Radiomyces spectabilis]|uniref:uncharacterized protein n=1 Tax=Radiomyces spectabilis TaxID=64574 RepID=UPI00221F8423|nr:uncharacterized protein BYT42DRAFT_556455 [Radiomyces spectabilis]KAI8391310.1 hypothetical protein BYT42DRAFT_556455 [Radiomyces spectabilis]
MSTKRYMANKSVFQPLLGEEAGSTSKKRQRSRIALAISLLTVFGGACVYLACQLPSTASTKAIQAENFWFDDATRVVAPGISLASFYHGFSKCQSIRERALAETNTTRLRHRNPRSATSKALVIKNGHLWLGDRYFDGDILIENGLISAIDETVDIPEGSQVIDAAGRVVTPGIVDMHSHMGVDSFPGLDALDDTNEMTSPTTPYVRVVDALNPSDPGIKIVASGGITTSLILPGSGNLMGGEAAVIKLRPVPTLSVQDMLITANVTSEDLEVTWRYMKMACGENPKGYYGGELKKMPMTRLGENYLFRRRFEEAQALMLKQDDWCDAAERINRTFPTDRPINEDSITRLSERYPENLELESLVALLRHQVILNVHCYLPQDLEAMVHHSLEFDFEIGSFHHALSAWQVPEIIKRAKSNITIATFGDMWGYKVEAWNQNVHAPKILSAAGIPVAFKSDHPVMNARDLLHEAQKAYHYGFNEHDSLRALTSVPANALGVGHRIGSLQVGKDADIVVWEQHPLRLGARPKHVVIDGTELDFKESWTKAVEEVVTDSTEATIERKHEEYRKDRHYLPPVSTSSMKLEDHGLDNPMSFDEACDNNVDSFVLRNISRLFMSPEEIYDASELGHDISMVVKEGKLLCAGTNCGRRNIDWPHFSPVFEMGGAVVIPGMISTGNPLGLQEIQAESRTTDGYAQNDVYDAALPQKIVRAVDGLKFNGLHLQKAFKAGVTASVSQPLIMGDLLAGVSVAFRTGTQNTVLDSNDTIIEDETALHFSVKNTGKLTVSQQIAAIRDLLLSNADKDGSVNVFARAAQGQLPVVVQTDNKDEIASILHMKQQLKEQSKGKLDVQFVILGGAEAYLVANHLSRLDVPVILMPARCYPATWQSRECLAGPPLTQKTGLDILLSYGVRVALASTDADNGDARNMIWEAGWNLAHNHDLSLSDAVGLVTWNPAKIFNLQKDANSAAAGIIQRHRKVDFVAYNDNPFILGSKVLMVYGGGRSGPVCFPKQV